MPSNRPSKKQLIIETAARLGLKSAGERELLAIQKELSDQLGEKGRTSMAYIAQVLQENNVAVRVQTFGPILDEPYASRLKGVLRFSNFDEAERSIRELDAACREYQASGDRAGTELVRAVALRGRRRAEALAANVRLAPEKRAEKQEIARWFGVWLQTPGIFSDWLELRKRSEEFHRQFGAA